MTGNEASVAPSEVKVESPALIHRLRGTGLEGVADARVAHRFRLALDMYAFGEQMALAGLRRRHSNATEDQIIRMLGAWRREPGRRYTRPGLPPVRVNVLEAALRRINADLRRLERQWALVGPRRAEGDRGTPQPPTEVP